MTFPPRRFVPIRHTVIAEKLHAITLLGITNTRLKDYLDLHVLLGSEALDMTVLARAVTATFTRRGMVVPATLPIGLTDAYALDPTRQALWRAFERSNALPVVPLNDLVLAIGERLTPVLNAARRLSLSCLSPTPGSRHFTDPFS